MITIRLIDARRGLHQQCESLFRDKTVADQIYWYLCDGLEGCDEVEPELKKGRWIDLGEDKAIRWQCSECGRKDTHIYNYCPDCGSDNRWC